MPDMIFKRCQSIFFIGILLCAGFFHPGISRAAIPDHSFPRLANPYLSWTLSEATARELAKWDVVILDMEIQYRSPDLLQKMRRWNPDIVLLVYITPQEIRQDAQSSFSVMRRRLASGIYDDWYLKDAHAGRLSWWPETYLLNVSNRAPIHSGQRLNTYIASFVSNELLSTGLWDGVFYDNSWDNISYFAGPDVDFDLNRRVDANADALWRDGMKTIYTETRRLAGDDIVLVGNSDNAQYFEELNGKLLENFSNSQWQKYIRTADVLTEGHKDPSVVIVNANTGNSGFQTNYRAVRFGLTTTLLEDAYYSYDFGDTNHGQTWWYDEYSVDLGDPLGDAAALSGATEYVRDVWRRDFDHGISLVNSTNVLQRIDLGGEFEKIHGAQDPTVNDGSIVSEIDLNARDGLILLKTFDSLDDVLFTNGTFVRFFRPEGERVRNGFFVFEEGEEGGDQVAHIDLDGNGKRDLLVVSGNQISAWRDDGQPYMQKKYPYTANYAGELRVAIGDLNNDGKMEIYVAPEAGYPAPIKIYTRHGRQIKNDWYPFGETYAGGYSMAVGNVDRLAGSELIVGAGSGIRPNVVIFDQFYNQIQRWLAFEAGFTGGVNVAAGDVDGDGVAEVIAGAGPGKKPLIRIFDADGVLQSEFEAYSTFAKPGIDIRALDVDFDGKDDILGLSSGPAF